MVDQDLVLAGADLARTAPELWRKFMHEFEAHVKRKVSLMLNAHSNVIQHCQGEAKEADYLQSMLSSAVETANTIKAGRR